MTIFLRTVLLCLSLTLTYTTGMVWADADSSLKISDLFSQIQSTELEGIKKITRQLIDMNDPEAFTRLESALTDKATDVNIRIEILRGIQASGSSSLLDAVLGSYLNSNNKTEEEEAKKTLQNMDSDKVADRLVERALDDLTMAAYRTACTEFLATITTDSRDLDICFQLLPLLDDDNETLQQAALQTMQTKSNIELGLDAAAWDKALTQLQIQNDPLKKRITELEQQLAQKTESNDELLALYIRVKLDYLLLKNEPELFVREIDPAQPVRLLRSVLEQIKLKKIDTPDCQTRLRSLLDHSDTQVRAATLALVGVFKMEDAVPTLAQGLQDPEETIRSACLLSLARMGKAGLKHWQKVATLLTDKTQPVDLRSRCATALASWARLHNTTQHNNILATLQAAYDNPDNPVRLRLEIVHGLQGIEAANSGLKVTHAILKSAIQDENDVIRGEAISQIKNKSYKRYKTSLLHLLGDEDDGNRKEAAAALEKIFGQQLLQDDAILQAMVKPRNATAQNEAAMLTLRLAQAAFAPEALTADNAKATYDQLLDFTTRLRGILKEGQPTPVTLILQGLQAKTINDLSAQMKKMKPDLTNSLWKFYLQKLSVLYTDAEVYDQALLLLQFLQTQMAENAPQELNHRIVFAEFDTGLHYDRMTGLLRELLKDPKLDEKNPLWWSIRYREAMTQHCLGKYDTSSALIDSLPNGPGVEAPAHQSEALASLRIENQRVSILKDTDLFQVRRLLQNYSTGNEAEKQQAATNLSKPETLLKLADVLRSTSSDQAMFETALALLNQALPTAFSLQHSAPLHKKVQTAILIRKALQQ